MAAVTEFKTFLRMETDVAEAASLDDLRADAAKNVFYDRTKGVLYRKFTEDAERTEDDLSDCIGGLHGLDYCPYVQVIFKNVADIDLSEGDCRNR